MGKLVRVINNRPSRVVIAREVRHTIKNEYGVDVNVLKNIDELTLEPGATAVDSERIDQFCNPALPCAKFFEEGILVVGELPEPKAKSLSKASGDLAAVEEPEALKIAATLRSKAEVEKQYGYETRAKVKNALKQRAEDLANGSSEDKD
jgi:hypothetical protein